MTFAFTPAERTALASLYAAHAAGGAAPVRYGAFPRLLDLGLIQRGPNGFAFVREAGDVDAVEEGIERVRRENEARERNAPPPPTEAERLALRDKVPRKMQDAMQKARESGRIRLMGEVAGSNPATRTTTLRRRRR